MIKKPYFFIYKIEQFAKNIVINSILPHKRIGFEQLYIPVANIDIETNDISYTSEFREDMIVSKEYQDELQYVKEHIFFNTESDIKRLKLKLKEYVDNNKINDIRLIFYDIDSKYNISYYKNLIYFRKLESIHFVDLIESIKAQEHNGLFQIYDRTHISNIKDKQIEALRRLEN